MKAFLFVSNTVIITPERARISDLSHLLSEPLFTEHEEADNFTIYVFLMYERLKGEASFWHLYFETAQFDELLMFWTAREQDQLQDPDLKWEAGTMLQQYNLQWGYVYNVIKFSQEFSSYDEPFLKGLFKWSYSLVGSRSFSSGLPSVMVVPLADHLNHENVSVCVDLVPIEAIHTLSFGTEYSDFT
jgi:hypothetical protein